MTRPAFPALRARKTTALRVAGYGLGLWFAVFAVAMALYPWRIANGPLFESLIAVALAAASVVATTRYLSGVSAGFLMHGLLCGGTWLAESLLFDWLAFSAGPMQMTLLEYFQDVAVTYLMIPVITVGLAWQRAQ